MKLQLFIKSLSRLSFSQILPPGFTLYGTNVMNSSALGFETSKVPDKYEIEILESQHLPDKNLNHTSYNGTLSGNHMSYFIML